MQNEARKMWHDDALKVNCTCVRVPIWRSHSESIATSITYPAGFVFAAIFLVLFLKATVMKKSAVGEGK